MYVSMYACMYVCITTAWLATCGTSLLHPSYIGHYIFMAIETAM